MLLECHLRRPGKLYSCYIAENLESLQPVSELDNLIQKLIKSFFSIGLTEVHLQCPKLMSRTFFFQIRICYYFAGGKQ